MTPRRPDENIVSVAALRARSPRIPLRGNAEVVGKRLADHLLCVAAYRVAAENGSDTVWAVPSSEAWTAPEITSMR